MTLDQLERDLRSMFAARAEELTPPDRAPHEVMAAAAAVDGRSGRRVGRGLWLAAAAVVGAALVAGLVTMGGPSSPVRTEPADRPSGGAPRFSYETPTVALSADRIEVSVGGRTFVPNDTVEVHSDPGIRNEYTTLELTWFEDGIEMRINLYFAAVNSDWWVSEVRTYDGGTPGEWIIIEEQHFLRPLGSAFEGDAVVGPLVMEGLRLEGFRAPRACAAAPQYGIEPAADELTGRVHTPGAGYAFGIRLFDATVCEEVPAAGFDVRFTSADEDVLQVVSSTGATADLRFVGPGTTTLRIEARDPDTGELWHTVDVPVTVE